MRMQANKAKDSAYLNVNPSTAVERAQTARGQRKSPTGEAVEADFDWCFRGSPSCLVRQGCFAFFEKPVVLRARLSMQVRRASLGCRISDGVAVDCGFVGARESWLEQDRTG